MSTEFQWTHSVWELSKAQSKHKGKCMTSTTEEAGGMGADPAERPCFLLEPELASNDQPALLHVLANHLVQPPYSSVSQR